MELIQKETENDLFESNVRLVSYMVGRICQEGTSSVSYEDLVQSGYLGLAEAARRYDGSGAFSTFACRRIRGEILDEIDREQGVTRAIRRDIRSWKDEEPEELALTRRGNMRAAVCYRMLRRIEVYGDTVRSGEDESGWESPMDEQIIENMDLQRALRKMSEGDLRMLWYRYGEDMSLREISKKTGLHRRKIQKQLEDAIDRLRTLLC